MGLRCIPRRQVERIVEVPDITYVDVTKEVKRRVEAPKTVVIEKPFEVEVVKTIYKEVLLEPEIITVEVPVARHKRLEVVSTLEVVTPIVQRVRNWFVPTKREVITPIRVPIEVEVIG